MKRILNFNLALLITFLLGTTYGCTKDQPQERLVDVSFNINAGFQRGGLKSANADSLAAPLVRADYVKAIINDQEYIINVLYVGDMPYTNTIKLAEGVYTISEFVAYSDNSNSNSNDDIPLVATPHLGSDFAQNVQHPLNYSFTVSGFNRLGFPIEVLSYSPEDYDHFGFTYF
jgi:hypothetical protein